MFSWFKNKELKQNKARVAIFVRTAVVDGPINQKEKQVLMPMLQKVFPNWSADQLQGVLTEIAALDIPAKNLSWMFEKEDMKKNFVLISMIQSVIYADGDTSQAERDWLADLLDASGLTREFWTLCFFFFLRRPSPGRSTPQPENDATRRRWLSLLEIAPDADEQTIKSAYRKAAAQFHPDKLGPVAEPLRKLAEEKLKDLNEAYEGLTEKVEREKPLDYLFSLAGNRWVQMDRLHQGDVVSCIHCYQANRLPEPSRFPLSRCGSCHALLGIEEELVKMYMGMFQGAAAS